VACAARNDFLNCTYINTVTKIKYTSHDSSVYKVQISNACSFSVAFSFTTCDTYFHIYSVLIFVRMKKCGGFWCTVVVCPCVTIFFVFCDLFEMYYYMILFYFIKE
jgi:hypothetical protein